jgi:anti-sigma factor RsiW
MDHNQIFELLPAYALGCLDDEDTIIVSEHLASCDTCNARLSAYRRTADLLSFGAPLANAPDGLKNELMNKIQPKITPIRRCLI